MKKDYEEKVPQARLEESRSQREVLLQKWGFEPITMMYMNKIHDRNLDVLIEDTLAQGSYIENNYNIRDGALSQTPAILIERLLKFYTEPGDIILNPMCERASHLLIANYLKRNVIGQDLSKRFIKHDIEKIKRRILSAQFLDPDNNKILREDENHFFTIYNGLRFDLTQGDSRHLDLPDNSVDHITTSPPYWDLESTYGDEPEQAGTGIGTGKGDTPTYEEFLEAMEEIYKECYRVLKKDRYMCVQVNDFRKEKIFFNYHGDSIKVLESVGFVQHDLLVYNISTHPLAAVFLSQIYDRKTFAKCHEFNICMRKI